jgi:virulence-associated protein VagC
MSQDEIEILLKIGNRFYEGKLHQKNGSQVSVLEPKRPIFPEPYGEMILITEEGHSWIIKPRQFLQTSDFAEIARIVKQYGGEYVSAGKSSHFRIPK